MARRRTKRDRGGNAGANTVLHFSFSDGLIKDLSRFEKKVCDSKNVDPIAKAYKVTSSGNKFYVAEPNGGAAQPRYVVTAYKNLTYEFDFSDSSMAGHRFRLSTSIDGPHEGGGQYSLGWSEAGTPGTANSKATFQVPSSAPSKLYYYCNNHGDMGATSSSNGYIKNSSIGQIGYSTGVYKSESISAHFSGDAGVFVSGDGYSHAGDLNIEKDFTISFWAKGGPTGYSEDQCLFDFGVLTGFVRSGVSSYISMATGWSGENINIENISRVDFTEWNHFCLMRKNSWLRYYINGTGQGAEIEFTGHLYSLSNSSTGRYHSIGCTRNYKNFYSGHMDDFFLHDIAVYGKDGFTPIREDVSGKFGSIAKDGLSAKHNVHNIYLITDGGYREFEMYNTDTLNVKLPSTGNIIPKDNTDYTKQYIYPFSGQDVILSFYKSPDLINAKDSTLKFYCDSGNGRELITTDEDGAPSKGSSFGKVYDNDIEITTNLKPQNWKYFSTGNIDVNATHLVINNIQPGYTGTWSAEHWEGNKVYSTQRQVIIKDVIAGTGCVRPEITGLEARGQIMSLADPVKLGNTNKPTWTGNCRDSNYLRYTYTWPGATGAFDPTGHSHYRIFSGWLDGDSLPAFDVVSGKRYDGSIDNSRIKFIISEKPLGKWGPWGHAGLQPHGTVGTTNHPTGAFRVGWRKTAIYKEFSFAEVSGTPVQTFKYYNKFDQKLYETSGRLLISGDGNQQDDNAIHGAACMYLTVVDKVSSEGCRISNGVEQVTCLEDCDKESRCGTGATPCVIVDTCEALMPPEFCCSGACGSYYRGGSLVVGWKGMGYTSQSECETDCVSCGAYLPIGVDQSPSGPISVYEGESVDFSVSAYRGFAGWYELSDIDYDSSNGQLREYISRGTSRGAKFSRSFCKAHNNNWYVPVFTHHQPPGGFVSSSCGGLSGIGTPVKITVKDGGDVRITWPIQDVNIKVKKGQKYNLSVSAEGAQPIYYSWYSGNGRPITPRDTQSNSVTVGPLSESVCYYADAWNGGCTYGGGLQQGDPFANKDTSANICIEVVDQTDEIQCCLDGKTREFQITGSSNCKIVSIKGYELWTDLMGSYTGASNYRHGRIIMPEVTSKSDKSWTTKWHQTSFSSQTGPAIEGVCYNSGTDTNKSQNNQWCSSAVAVGNIIPCFTVSGCPDKIIYEVITHEPTNRNAYSEYFGESNRNKRIERRQYFEDNPLGQTGHLYVQYASSINYTGGGWNAPPCGYKRLSLNWVFPPYDNGNASVPVCIHSGTAEGAGWSWGWDDACEMGAYIPPLDWWDESWNNSFTPRIGQITETQHISGYWTHTEWNSDFTGLLHFTWSGQTPTGLGPYFRIPYGNIAGINGDKTPYKGVGAADRDNDNAIFTGDVNMWDIKIVRNTNSGMEGSGSYDYTAHYLSGSSELVTFTRTLKDNYFNIRTDSNRTLINLSDYVPASARYVGGYARTRSVLLHTAYQTNFIFAVNSVNKTDSYSAGLQPSGANQYYSPWNGFTRYTEDTELWCHHSGHYEPFLIYNGWYNMCNGATAATSGACYAAGPTGCEGGGSAECFEGEPCHCEPIDVTDARQEMAYDMASIDEMPYHVSRYLDLTFVMQSGDALYYEGTEYSGWNSFCHGHFLAVNQSSGNWSNFTGCAEISTFQTFVNGQEV